MNATTIDLDALMGELTRSAHIEDEGARAVRIAGGEWPADGAVTMIGHARLANIRESIESVVRAGVPGDVIECGVWRGGACIFMRAVLESLGVRDRIVWVADSFQGCPEGDEHATFTALRVPQETVMENFDVFGFLDSQVRFLPGFFADSLPGPVEQLAVLRIDCDMYIGYRQVLETLYPKLSPGGFVILDDYYLLGTASRAVEEYRAAHSIRTPIVKIDQYAGYWQKETN